MTITTWLYAAGSDDSDRPLARPRARRETALAVLGVLAFALVLLHPQIARMHAVPDIGDPLFSIWRMGWVHQQLRGDARGLFDGNIFHPERLTLTLSDAMLLPSMAASPLLAAGVHPVVAYNLVLLGAFVLSALTCFLLVRYLTGSALAAFVAGLVFGFYPYRFEHYGHLELHMTAFMPLALLGVHRFLAGDGARWAVVAALSGVAQLYSSMYYGVFLALYALVLGAALTLSSRIPVRRLLAAAGLMAAACALLALPLALPYLASRDIRADRPAAEVAHYSATPMDFLRAHRRSAFWAGLTPPGRQEERQLFPGATPVALAAVSLMPPLGPVRLAYLTALVFSVDASLGLNGWLYPVLYEWVPPVRGLRVPARFSILVGLTLAVLCGFALRRLCAGVPRWRARAWTAVLAALVAIDVWPILHLQDVWRAPPAIYAALLDREDVILAEFPSGPPFPATPYMYFSLWHWRPLVNGYSGHHPQSYVEILPLLELFPLPETVAALRARGVTHVTVNCALFRRARFEWRCPRALAAVEASGWFREIARDEWEGDQVVLFALIEG